MNMTTTGVLFNIALTIITTSNDIDIDTIALLPDICDIILATSFSAPVWTTAYPTTNKHITDIRAEFANPLNISEVLIFGDGKKWKNNNKQETMIIEVSSSGILSIA